MKKEWNQSGVISIRTLAIILVFILIVGGLIGAFIFFNPVAPCNCGDVETNELQDPRRTWWRGSGGTFIEFHHIVNPQLPSPELRWRVEIRNPLPQPLEDPPVAFFWAESLADVQAIAEEQSNLGNPSGDDTMKLVECIAGFTCDKSILGEESCAEFRRATCE